MSEEVVFEVEYKCNNCTKEFKKKYSENVTVKYKSYNNYVTEKRPTKTFIQRLFGLNDISFVRCSNCNSTNVILEDRRLIE